MGGVACRSLFVPDRINQDKKEMEGDWGAAGLVLCLDLDTGNELIAVLTPKIEGRMFFFFILFE